MGLNVDMSCPIPADASAHQLVADVVAYGLTQLLQGQGAAAPAQGSCEGWEKQTFQPFHPHMDVHAFCEWY